MTQSNYDNSGALTRERDRIHRQMMSSVSHDLKTPLASIIGSLEIFTRMQNKLPEEKRRALIQVALQEAYRLDNFITNILDMAKLENGVIKIAQEEVEIGTLLSNCLTRLSNRLYGCTIDLDPTAPLAVTTDPILLSRAVCVVLDNAVKYGGSPPAIYIRFGPHNTGGFISIRDNGKGIPDSQMEAIFSKYTRLAKEDQQNAGTGLGLPIGRTIMGLLGGNLVPANHPEGGALFTLRFPLSMKR